MSDEIDAIDRMVAYAEDVIKEGKNAVLYFGSHKVAVHGIDDDDGITIACDVAGGAGFVMAREALLAVGEAPRPAEPAPLQEFSADDPFGDGS